jgi:hypothetical protein
MSNLVHHAAMNSLLASNKLLADAQDELERLIAMQDVATVLQSGDTHNLAAITHHLGNMRMIVDSQCEKIHKQLREQAATPAAAPEQPNV